MRCCRSRRSRHLPGACVARPAPVTQQWHAGLAGASSKETDLCRQGPYGICHNSYVPWHHQGCQCGVVRAGRWRRLLQPLRQGGTPVSYTSLPPPRPCALISGIHIYITAV